MTTTATQPPEYRHLRQLQDEAKAIAARACNLNDYETMSTARHSATTLGNAAWRLTVDGPSYLEAARAFIRAGQKAIEDLSARLVANDREHNLCAKGGCIFA